MGRKEKDNYSTTSMASKASGERARKPPRFSLQRIFYRAGRPPSFTSTRSSSRRPARSTSEIEARSTTSIQSSNAQTAPQVSLSISLDDSNSSVSTSPPNPIQSEARDCHSSQSGDSLECPLCLSHQPSENFPIVMTCHHRSCKDCLQQYLRIEITESRVNIACPECAERFHPNDIQMILENAHLMHKYEEFMMRRVLVTDPDTRWCPAPDCGYAVIATGCASCPKLKCERPSCDTYFCYHCKQYWHPNQTCDAARAERSSNLRSSSITCSFESSSHNDIKPCPRCGAFIVKMDDGSCNHMTCAVCGAEFCWLCMKEISDLHYLSPSGCTFWGKKPWSRKKKILWQLGTLVGAPVGISLIAGISVPAIIIGVPVYVGRKLHAKYQYSSKHKRNLIVTGGVTASIVLSPVLAGIAVGIGVPILLAYVYGVVPISLCRSGGCGVTTNEKGGVRFEFDEEVEGATGTQAAQTQGVGDSQSVETTTPHHVANPSIGPSIGEMSLGMTASLSASGSHLERVGGIMLREDSVDRDSASNRALAGASLNGSLCGSAGAAAYHHRLEVHADMSNTASNHKRNSLSSESANLSLDAKSATVSFGDNASTKALAGSICAPREKDGASVILPPLEVQVDVSASTARYQPTVQQAPPSISASTNTMPVTERADPQQDSPSASRSVNFLNEVASSSAAVSKHYCQRQSVSVGDSLHVEPQKKLHRAEVCSFTGPDVAIAEGRSGPSCVSVDSVLTVNRTAGRRGLVEVENDRRLVSCSSSTDSNSSDMTMESTCSVHKPVCGSFRGSGCCMHGPAMSGSAGRGAMGGSTSSSCGSSVGPDTPLIVTGVSSNSSTS